MSIQGLRVAPDGIGRIVTKVRIILRRSMVANLQIRAVAEVVRSENCFAQVKVGDNLVFDPFLNSEKSNGVICPRALLPVLVQIRAIWRTQVEWAESRKEELPEIVWRSVGCLDPGLEDCGTGGVVHRIRLERVAP
jgi:hypothetical protein